MALFVLASFRSLSIDAPVLPASILFMLVRASPCPFRFVLPLAPTPSAFSARLYFIHTRHTLTRPIKQNACVPVESVTRHTYNPRFQTPVQSLMSLAG